MTARKKTLEQIKIESIGYGGVGISTLPNGKKVLVKGGALPHSVVDIWITREKKDYVEGHITKISSHDTSFADGEVFCPHYFSQLDSSQTPDTNPSKVGCGGCKWQVMSYTKQLELKERIVLDNFRRIFQHQSVQVFTILGSPLEKGYRNKIEFSFGKFVSGKGDEKNILSDRSVGFHKQGEFSKIVDIDSCGLVSQKMDDIFSHLKKLLKQSGLPVYDQKTHQGVLRHLVMREAVHTDQILVNLVVSDKQIADLQLDQTRNALKQSFLQDEFLQAKVSCFFVTKNNGLADIVRGPEIQTEIRRGDGYIFEKLIFGEHKDTEDEHSDLPQNTSISTFRVSPFSFFQTNTYGAESLFGRASQLIGKIKGHILDLYCGTGTIGLSFLGMGIGKELIGVEIVEAAIEDARKNAEINKLKDRCTFAAGPAEKIVYELPHIQKKLEELELVIIDPPREGIHKKVVTFLQELKQQKNFKLLYISCNPVTMARDVELLCESGLFKLINLQAVDMFPQTHHIECIGVLS